MNWVSGWFKPPTSAAADDDAAMRRVRTDGDPAEFAWLVHRWEAPIRRLCTRMCGDEHRGEDLAQDAFARVFANRERFDPNRKFSTWLWRIALNLCHEELRRSAVRDERPLDDDAGGASSADETPQSRAARSEQGAIVRDALMRLPESYRTVVILREYENLKFREIADVLGIPEGTVKWRMSEALDRLARELRPVIGGGDVATRSELPETHRERLVL